ncbi:MAG: phosphopentomutase [Desulfobacula sp.]|nr:phosphopentomutase [Desulfobacula sp.]
MQAIVLIIDSFGVGALPDAENYDDKGANTALHICEAIPFEKWPCLKSLGLGNCTNILGTVLPGCEPVSNPLASFGVMAEKSEGKDTTTGHWELAGINLEEPFHTFPPEFPSFPEKLLQDLQSRTGHRILGNKSASGTKIIEELGPAHMEGKGIIVYTSADSVLQIAAHEKIVSVKELYRICNTAREICDRYNVGRVIARPFTGTKGNFIRTESRKDFSMEPPGETILDHLKTNGVETVGIGKIGDIFAHQGLDKSFHDKGNKACLDRTLACMKQKKGNDQFLFVNLVDTDMLFGHRRDIKGYCDAVQKIDDSLVNVIDLMSDSDLLIITADHGCDPGFKGTDHTREYVPLLVYKKKREVMNLKIRTSFCDVAQSLASFFNVPALRHGKSFI